MKMQIQSTKQAKTFNNFTSNKRASLLLCSIMVVIALVTLCFAAGCTSSMPKIKQDEFPNKVVEQAQINQEYKDIANQIAPQLIEEFMAITKIPHTTFHLEQITPYIQNKINEYGSQAQLDAPSGSVYADIPATNSKEWQNKPMVILQAHMDMVGKVADGYTTFNPDTMAVDAIYDQDNSTIHSKDYLTNIGADDGQGMAFMLATLKNKDNFNHGPIRLLFTANEEMGCVGARDLTATIVNAPYLINLDGYQIGNVLTSSTGSIRGMYTNNFTQVSPEATDKLLTVSISNLAGGHTGVDTVKSRLHGERYTMEFFQKLDENNINYKFSLINCGSLTNAYQSALTLQFYVDQSQVENVKKIFTEDIQNRKKQYTDDNDFNYEITAAETTSTKPCISKIDTKKIMNLLAKLPEGVLAEGKVSADIPETACAIGVLNLSDGKFETCAMLRSSNNDTINEYARKFPEIASSTGFVYKEVSKMNAWPNDLNNKLRDTMFESYKKVGNFEGIETATFGGLETSHFLAKNPNIKMISVGLDYFHEHMTTETYYTSTTNMHIATVFYTLQHLS